MDLSPLVSQNNRRIEPVVENPMVSFKSSNAFIMFSFKVKKKEFHWEKKLFGTVNRGCVPPPRQYLE